MLYRITWIVFILLMWFLGMTAEDGSFWIVNTVFYVGSELRDVIKDTQRDD